MDINFVSTSFDDYIVNKYFQGQLTSYWPWSFIEKLFSQVKRRLQLKYLSMSAIKRIRKINYLCAIIRILLLICTSFFFYCVYCYVVWFYGIGLYWLRTVLKYSPIWFFKICDVILLYRTSNTIFELKV